MANYQFGLGEEPHKRWPVAWYNPAVLWQSAREMMSTSDVIRNADPRELWTGQFEGHCHADDAAPDGAFWFDFVSDTGDGGNATYTVARALLADSLAPSGSAAQGEYPRGQVLFLGGDLSYPGASALEYQYRFLEMFEGARPETGPDKAGRHAYAIPQNHDWFDSISTFKRYFVNRDNGDVCGLRTPQKRSYFATRLPHGWWVLGFDFALEGDLDRGQYEAFRRLAGDVIRDVANPELQLHSGVQLILLYPEPYWTRPLGDDARPGYPKRYQRLEAIFESKGLHIRMRLAGDVHHYRRESSAPADPQGDDLLLTCGSGGAFLHPTHATDLDAPKVREHASDPDAISPELRTATRVGTVQPGPDAEGAYTRQAVYPDPSASRKLSAGNVLALFKFGWNSCSLQGGRFGDGILHGNVFFVLVLAALYGLGMYFTALAMPSVAPEAHCWQLIGVWGRALFHSPAALAVHAVLLAMFCGLVAGEKGWLTKGLLHFAAHAVAIAAIFSVAAYINGPGPVCGLRLALLVLWCLVSSLLCAGLITGFFLACMAWKGHLYNNAFSPLACEDYKGFLRFRLDGDGTLTGYFFGCDTVPKQWQRNPAGGGKAAGDVRPAWVEAPGEAAAQWRLVDRFTLKRRITTNSGS